MLSKDVVDNQIKALRLEKGPSQEEFWGTGNAKTI